MKKYVQGVHYSYETHGKGEPLLLLHGFTGSRQTWAPFIPKWSKKFQLISVDIIGHGETGAPEPIEHYHMAAVADTLESLLNDIGIRKTHVLGYSMGGRLALYLAIKHSHLIKDVLLESASPGLSSQSERDARIKNDTALASKILNHGVEKFVNEWEKLPLFETQETLQDSVKESIRKERLSHTPQGLANSLLGMGTGQQPSLWDNLSHCQKQVMLVVGSLDQKFMNIATQMEERLPHCQKIIVDGVGHAVHVESPELFGNIVNEDFYRIIG